jgi:hypothetical protein
MSSVSKTTQEIIQLPLDYVMSVGKRNIVGGSVRIWIPHATITGRLGTVERNAFTGKMSRVRDKDN